MFDDIEKTLWALAHKLRALFAWPIRWVLLLVASPGSQIKAVGAPSGN